MKAFVVGSLAIVAMAAPPAAADGPRASGANSTHQRAAVVPRRQYHYGSPLYAFYPPTVIRDGRSYFYYPSRYPSEGTRDRPVHPAEEYQSRHRHRWWR